MKCFGGGNKRRGGFTIVELLIVIVVIGILAAITIVAFNGIQERSKNTQTVNAVASYVKLMNMYKADEGTHPQVVDVCLGEGYAGGQCRPGYQEDGSDINSVHLAKYLKGDPPKPDMTVLQYNSTLAMAGVWYTYGSATYNSSGGGLGVVILGTGNCPSITGTSPSASGSTLTEDGKGRLCRYAIN